MPVGEVAGMGECHAVLDDAAALDADAVKGSNSTYVFAGIDAAKGESVFTCTYLCRCPACRAQPLPCTEYTSCPYILTTGKWMQHTCLSDTGIVQQKQRQKEATATFALRVEADRPYAAYGSFKEQLGKRPYWLLRSVTAAYARVQNPSMSDPSLPPSVFILL